MEQLRSTPLEGFWLSPQQKRLWILSQGRLAPICQCTLLVEGSLDPQRLHSALKLLLERHEILRTTFNTMAGMELPLQVIADESEPELRHVDWSEADAGEEDAGLEPLLRIERQFAMDVAEGPVARFCLAALASGKQALVVTVSSLCADAAGLDNFAVELGRLYLAAEGIAGELEEPVQYVQFSEWQNEILEEQDEAGEPGRRYWGSRAAAPGPVPNLPSEVEAKAESLPAEVLRVPLPPALHAALKDRTARSGFAPEAVLLAAWWSTLVRLTGSETLEVAVRCPGRVYEEMRGALGLYERWPGIGGSLRSDFRFRDVVQACGRELAEALQWQEFFAAGSEAERGFGFDFSQRSDEPVQAGPVRLRLVHLYTWTEELKLRLSVSSHDEGTDLTLYHRAERLTRAQVERIAENLFVVLADGLRAPDSPVVDLEFLGRGDRGLLDAWNRTERERPAEERLPALFSARVERHPEAVAVISRQQRLQFGELEIEANRIAHLLLELEVRADDRVALFLERSTEMIAALLGVLKAGAAYVPLDPGQPAERLAGMLDDSGAAAVLTLARLAPRLPAGDRRTVLLDGDPEGLQRQPGTAPELQSGAENLAYVLYTSGSTGRPKGTLIEQRSVANLVLALDEAIYARLAADGPLRVTVNAPLSFDGSVKQWTRLLRGDSLVIVPEDLRADGVELLAWVRREEVDVLDCTPSQLRLLLAAGLAEGPGAPRALLVGGEAMDPALWDAVAADRHRLYFNVYGPTECTVDSAIDEVAAGRVPTIGRAIANVELYVLDAALRRLPIGLAGELCVGGAGLARGYLGRPDLTAEKFVPDPHGGRSGRRLYRTGDRVRFQPDGRLEFLGRLDHQVKLRGFRIELGEIEEALAGHPDVGEAVVLLREDQERQPRLVAYTVPKRRSSASLAGKPRHRLPNGLLVAHQNRNETEYLYQEIFEKRCYAQHGIELPDDACILDVGANIGMFTLFAHQECANPRVFAFEPIPGIFESLRVNCELYGAGVRLFPIGLSNRPRTERFAYYPRYTMMSSQSEYARPGSEVEVVKRFLERQIETGDLQAGALLGSADELLAGRFELREVEATLRRLSDVIREEGVGRVDLLKIDVQRAELDVLHGIDEEHWDRIDQVVMEVHDSPGEETHGRVDEIRRLLQSHGFQVVVEQDELLIGTDRHNLYAWRSGRVRRSSGAAAPDLTDRLRERDRPADLSPEDLREHLRRRLPDYMVPAACVVLEEMPLTRNGKVDRRALPAPEEVVSESRNTLAPRTAVEEILVGIFTEVLGTEPPGADESFFDLGGHSLLATQVIARVRQAFQVDLPLRLLFEEPTAIGLGRRVEEALAGGARLKAPPIRPVPRGGPLPLSFAQQRLWFLHQLAPGDPTYHNPIGLRIRGPLDVAAVAGTLAEIVRRHEILRTTYSDVDGKPMQQVALLAPPVLPLVDLSALPEPIREEEVRVLFRAEARRPFHLLREAPIRTTLLRLGDEEHALLLLLHHIACDAWSLIVLERELAELYGAFSSRRPSTLPDLPIQYADFASWEREWLQGEVLELQMAFWRERLAGAPVLELPLDRPRQPFQSPRGEKLGFSLLASVSHALSELGQRQGATLFMTLLAGFQALLARYSGQRDVSVGTPIAGRRHIETEGLIGFFVNTLVLRSDVTGNPAFAELLGRVREGALQAYAHQELPFERLVDELAPRRDMAHTPLFQVLFGVQSVGSGEESRTSALDLSPLGAETGTAKFDLTLMMVDRGGTIRGSFEYRTALFERTTVAHLSDHLTRLLASAAAAPETPLSDLSLLAPEEVHQILGEWGGTGEVSGAESTLHGLIGAQVERTPDAVAVTFEGESLSYRELDRRSGALALRLRRLGVGPEVRVGICAERSLELVVGLVGILKAGGAYVPLDPVYPDGRLSVILEDAGAEVLLTQGHLRERLRVLSGSTMRLVDLDVAEGGDGGWFDTSVGPDNAVYVIFTSGSTGRPKGAINSHRGVVNRLLWMQDAYGLGAEDRVLQKTPFSFDVSVWEFFWPLMTGARLVLATPGGHQDPAYLVRTIASECITHVHFVPSMLRAFLEEPDLERCSCLKRVIASGEALPVDLADRFHERLGGLGVELHNLYGPTEAAVEVTYHACLAGEERVPIGRPLDGVRLRVLDREGQLVPAGVAGELHIGGVQVARGYQGRAELTAERFVPDPFGEPGSRLYRTGDLARHLPDGELEYLGRIDQQVKLRGFRIELGEIESVLSGHPEVREAVVLAREGRLVGYVSPAKIDLSAVREHLRRQLPEYMVPSAWVALERLPLSPNGKLDRQALAEPEAVAEAESTPRGELEELVASIWSEVLRREAVGAGEDFFAIGGHSLLATRVMARIRAAFGVELPLRALFESPTVAGLAARVEEAMRGGRGQSRPPLVPVPRSGPLPLSFSQQRLWFLDQLEPGSAQYNMPSALRLSGALEIGALAAAFGEVVRRHESLRTSFAVSSGEAMQVVASPSDWSLPVVDLSSLPEPIRESEARRLARREAARPFDLGLGPVLRTSLLRLDVDEHVLLSTLHHISGDGWSLDLLVRELSVLYGAACCGEASPLPELPVQYGDFAVWQRQWLSGAVLEEELSYWRGRLGESEEVLELPLDHPRPAVRRHRGASHGFLLPEVVSSGLLALARREGATPFMVLLAGLQALLFRYTGQTGIRVGTPVAGRNQLETEGLIGFFVNTLVMRTELSGDLSPIDLLGRVREAALEAYVHQDVPFEKLVEELQPQRHLSRTPLFQVSFAFQAAGSRPRPELPRLRIESQESATGTAKFDLSLAMMQRESSLGGSLMYDADLFESSTGARMVEHLKCLLGALAAGSRLDELPLLGEVELHQLTSEWSDTAAAYERDGCVHELFAQQAQRTPGSQAVLFGDERLTYAELDRKSNRMAHLLRSRGVGLESLVGLLLERSAETIVAMLGVLKAGGAYVPLDPSYPRERLALLASGLDLVVSVREAEALEPWPETPLAARVAAEGLAYVIFTSGSTGVPKGVAVTHRAILRLVRNTDYVRLSPGDRVAQASTAAFDAATFEIWGALLNGATVVGVPRDVALSPPLLAGQLRRDRIDVLFLTTALFHQLATEAPDALSALRDLLFGGEAVDPVRVRSLLAAGGGPGRLLHVYGPTESTTFATWQRVEEVPEGATTVPIGRPIANTRLQVVDRGLRPVPIGVVGELCLGGDGLARGYVERPDLTAERFVPDPLAEGERLYRTGDLCRRLPAGGIEFLGRADTQVKVRGFRVELAEVESALALHPSVREAVVAARQESDGPGRRLVAYVVPAGDGEPSALALRSFLQEKLPEPMIPAAFVALPALPLNANGKVDRRALPEPGPDAVAGTSAATVPRNAVEEMIAAIWGDLLGVERVGIDADFFALGGHSLLATRVISRIRAAFGVELPLRALFESPTVAGLAREVEGRLRSGGRTEAPQITSMSRTGPLPLSFAQERLWFLHQLEPGSAAYNIPVALRLGGPLDVAALAASLAEVVRRHEVLRTRFVEIDGGPAQVVAPATAMDLPVVDLSFLPETMRERETRRLAKQEADAPFDLARGPVLRTRLLRLAAGEHALLLTLHHIAGDGWSLGVLTGELDRLYPAFCSRRPVRLADLPVQYADFALWQRSWMRGEALESGLSYWREHLGGAAALELPTDRPRRAMASRRGASRALAVGPELSRDLQRLARRYGVTPFMLLLAAFQVLLGRHASQQDVSVGTPVAGRDRLELEQLIGFFVNTLVLRTDLSGRPTFAELLQRVRDVVLEAHLHQDTPFERLVEELAPARRLDRDPLFQVMFSYQNLPVADAPGGVGNKVAKLGASGGWEQFDLTLTLQPVESGFAGTFSYRLDLFDDATVERMLARFLILLEHAVSSPETRLPDLRMMTPEEERQIRVEWSGALAPDAGSSTLHGLFEEQARRAREAVAVMFEGSALSYGELDGRAAAMAGGLRKRGAGPEVRVGVCAQRSPDLLVAALGVLKAGGVYVPLDPDSPDSRLSMLLEAGGISLVLADGASRERLRGLAAGKAQVAALADVPAETLDAGPDAEPENAAYVIFTSGSTGRPKGVVVTHGAITSRLLSGWQPAGLAATDRLLQKASPGFDVSLWEMFAPLAAGASVVPARPGGQQDAAYLVRTIAGERITHVDFVPSMLRVFLEEPGLEACTSLQVVTVGGEALPEDVARRFGERLGAPMGVRLVNLYGPTEAAVDVTHHLCRPGERIAIGRPVRGVRIYLLDSDGSPVPPGAAGELCIGGAQLARGYLGRADLTAERFVPDAFGEPGSRLYRTGDRARFLPGGDLDFIGRIDRQVKIRGFRVELEEIEAVLRGLPAVGDAAVVVDEAAQGGARLLAAAVAAEGALPEAAELQQSLRRELPQGMVPTVVVLDGLPRLPNEKLDRAALLSMLRQVPSAVGSLAPRDAVELDLASIAAEVLGEPALGIRDDFFSLGGHSLLAVRYLARIRKRFGVDLPLSLLFQCPTVEALAAALRRRGELSAPSTLVEIQGRGERPPIFCVHPVGGNVLCYSELARELGPDQPFYGLQSPPPDQGDLSLERMAAQYLEAVRSLQPEGPIRLAGWSMGGVVAYEMACQLGERGEEVDLLVLIDAAAPAHPAYPREDGREQLLASFARDLAALSGVSGMSFECAVTAGMATGEAFSHLLREARSRDLMPPDLEEEDLRRWFEIFCRNQAAMAGYTARPYSGRVVLLRAAETAPWDAGALGWEPLAAQPVDMRILPGNHYSLLRGGSAGRLAALIRELAEQT